MHVLIYIYICVRAEEDMTGYMVELTFDLTHRQSIVCEWKAPVIL